MSSPVRPNSAVDAVGAGRGAALLPVEIARDLLDTYFASDRGCAGRAVYGSVLLLLLGGAGTLPFARVQLSVHARGTIRPARESVGHLGTPQGVVERALVTGHAGRPGGDTTLVPDRADPPRALIADLYVAPRDVGLLRVGSRARLQVDAFGPLAPGTATGRVVSIADAAADVEGRPMFRVRCTLDAAELAAPGGARGRIRTGMTVRARFPVARPSVWELLRAGAGASVDRYRGRSGADGR
jgi:hypothetical protein